MPDLSQLSGLPPQATGATLPGQAQALGPAASAPIQPLDPTALLQDANFGDGASQRISQLQAAGAPPPVAPEAEQSAAGTIGRSVAAPGDVEEPALANVANGAGTEQDPIATMQNVAMMRLSFLKSLHDQNIPIPTRAKVIADQGRQMGRMISPALSELIARIFDGRDLTLAEQRVKSGDPDFLTKLGADLPDAQSYLSLGDDMKKYEDGIAHNRALLAASPTYPTMGEVPPSPLVAMPEPPGNAPIPAMQFGGTVDEGQGAVVGDNGPEHIQDVPGVGVKVTPLESPGLGSLAATNAPPINTPTYDPIQRMVTSFVSDDPTRYESRLAEQQRVAGATAESQQRMATVVRDNYKGLYADAKQIMTDYPSTAWEPMIRQRAAERGLQVNPALIAGTAKHAEDDKELSSALNKYLSGQPLPDLSKLGLDAGQQAAFLKNAYVLKAAKRTAEEPFGIANLKELPPSDRGIAVELINKGMSFGSPEFNQAMAERKAEAKSPPASQQRVLQQLTTALAPIDRLEAQLADPKYASVVDKLGPQYTMPNPITGSTRALPFTSDTEGTSHDNISHPLNVLWYNYKQGGKDMTPEEREVMSTLGTVSASGWQGLTSGIRNRAVIEDVKQHIPRPWDDPDLIRAKIGWIKEWYTAIKAGVAQGGQTFKALQDESAANPVNIPFKGAPGKEPQGPPSGPGVGASTPARVTTRADVEALPVGAPYINPADGRTLYKK